MPMTGSFTVRRLEHDILLRVVLYYVFLALAIAAIWYWIPASVATALAEPWAEITGGGGLGRAAGRAALTEVQQATPQGTLFVASLLAIISALLLALPVAWVYTLTRSKKGYRQSVVQTLVMLPLVVAGVAVLVKHSLALAFSLAGIVAAVRFRNNLDDSKDAVYIFLATAIGLASGVQVTVAGVLSVVFNTLVVLLWYTDFGSTPAALEGARAAAKLEKAREHLSRTSSFVAHLDDELLKAMSPVQLDALADRAWRRRKRMSPDFEDHERTEYDALVRVRTGDAGACRELVDPVMAERVSRWRLGGVLHDPDGTHVLEYTLQLESEDARDALLSEIRSRGGALVLDCEVR